MYNVVADVDAYKDFVPWCQESRVMQRWSTGPNVKRYNAELCVGFGAISERYTSNVTAATPLDARGSYRVEVCAWVCMVMIETCVGCRVRHDVV